MVLSVPTLIGYGRRGLEWRVDLGGKLIPRQLAAQPFAVKRLLQRAHIELEQGLGLLRELCGTGPRAVYPPHAARRPRGQLTSARPAMTSTIASEKPQLRVSPNTSQPASTPTSGVMKVKAESSATA